MCSIFSFEKCSIRKNSFSLNMSLKVSHFNRRTHNHLNHYLFPFHDQQSIFSFNLHPTFNIAIPIDRWGCFVSQHVKYFRDLMMKYRFLKCFVIFLQLKYGAGIHYYTIKIFSENLFAIKMSSTEVLLSDMACQHIQIILTKHSLDSS